MLGRPAFAGTPPMLDVLQMLPLDAVDINIWQQLLLQGGCGSLKLTCRQSRQLADSLTQDVTYSLAAERKRLTDERKRQADPLAEQGSGSSSACARAAAAARQHRTTFLGRLPSLSSVALHYWPSEAQLVRELLTCVSATQSRVKRLALRGDGPLSAASMRAVRLACPALVELELEDPCEFGTHGALKGGEGYCQAQDLQLRGPLFQPLHTAHNLTKLVILGEVNASWHTLDSLGGLVHLRHLQLTLGYFHPTHLAPLAGLLELRHCDLSARRLHLSLADVAPLLSSTHLTTLRLPNVQHGVGLRPDDDAAGGSSESSSDGPRAAALSLLGALRGLQSLHFGDEFVVDDTAFTAVRCLTQLTALRVGHIRLAAPTPGNLPLLQHLRAAWGGDDRRRPSELLQLLLPLLPLPSLTQLHLLPRDCFAIVLDADYRGGDGAAAEAVALTLVAECLAAAPGLPLRCEVHLEHGRVGSDGFLALPEVERCLQPLAGRVTSLVLEHMGVEGPWDAVQSSLPCLRTLGFKWCRVSATQMYTILQHVTSVQRLWVREAHFVREPPGPEGPEAGGGQEGLAGAAAERPGGASAERAERWLEVARVCSRPLRLGVTGGVPAEVVSRCEAIQQELFGRQNIRWSDGDVSNEDE